MNALYEFDKQIEEARTAENLARQRVFDLEKQKENYIKQDLRQNVMTDIAISVAEKILETYKNEDYPDYYDTVCRSSSYKKDETEREMKVRVLKDYQINIDTNSNKVILDHWWAEDIDDVLNLSIEIKPYES